MSILYLFIYLFLFDFCFWCSKAVWKCLRSDAYTWAHILPSTEISLLLIRKNISKSYRVFSLASATKSILNQSEFKKKRQKIHKKAEKNLRTRDWICVKGGKSAAANQNMFHFSINSTDVCYCCRQNPVKNSVYSLFSFSYFLRHFLVDIIVFVRCLCCCSWIASILLHFLHHL